MRIISEQELKDILDKHGKWLRNEGFKNPKLAKSLNYSYWVCENGNIASAINPCLSLRQIPKILSNRISNSGYKHFFYKKKNMLVHRVIAAEFIGDIDNKIVHHKDSNKLNNSVENLIITDYSENNKHGFENRIKAYGLFIKMCAEMQLTKTDKDEGER